MAYCFICVYLSYFTFDLFLIECRCVCSSSVVVLKFISAVIIIMIDSNRSPPTVSSLRIIGVFFPALVFMSGLINSLMLVLVFEARISCSLEELLA